MKRLILLLCGALLVSALFSAGPSLALEERNLSDAPPPATAKPAPTPDAPAPQAATPPASDATAPPSGEYSPPPPPPPPPQSDADRKRYNREEIKREVEGFFESGSEGLAEILSRPFDRYGKPNGFIKGNEGAGAFIVGLRYGEGTLHLKGRRPVKVYWQSPSVGLDIGANAAKVFTLVYNMDKPEQIFQRFPGINGSAYILGGFNLTYQQSGDVILAPIRFGVGLRLGADVGYMHYTREATMNPF